MAAGYASSPVRLKRWPSITSCASRLSGRFTAAWLAARPAPRFAQLRQFNYLIRRRFDKPLLNMESLVRPAAHCAPGKKRFAGVLPEVIYPDDLNKSHN
jgi:hypothetical protein